MTYQSTEQFRIPISFPIASYSGLSGNELPGILESTLSTSIPTAIENYSVVGSSGEDESHGVVIGCTDGTLYVLHSQPPLSVDPVTTRGPEINEPLQRSSRRISKISQNHSRSTSPSFGAFSLSPAFNVTAKPRVVSGVTTEQVEAPKNYVDFDDEPDKLKDILKGKNPRERPVVADSSSDRAPKSEAPSVIESAPPVRRKNAAPRSLLSAANSRASSPPPFSTPSSPGVCSPSHTMWKLRYHIIPTRSGFGHAVRSIQFLRDSPSFVVLQESGDLQLYSSDDGSCKISVHADDGSLDLITGRTERLGPRDSWMWSNLTISYVGESVYFILRAAYSGGAPALIGDSDEGSFKSSKCALFEYIYSPSHLQLKKRGQWEFDGATLQDGLHLENEGSLIFYSASHDGHFNVRELKFTSSTPEHVEGTQPSHSEAESKTGHGPHLSIPHALKSIMARSSEHLPANEKGIPETTVPSISLSDPHDVGVLLANFTPLGLETRLSESGIIKGIVWNQEEMTLFEYADRSAKSLFHYPAVGLQGGKWLDDEMYALYFEEYVEVFKTKLVNADNDDVHEQAEPSLLRMQPELVHSCNIGRYDAVKVISNSILLSRSLDERRSLEVVSYPIPEGKSPQDGPQLPRLLWRSNGSRKAVSPTLLSNILPLDSETFVHGYSDGRLHQFSLVQLTRKGDAPFLSMASSTKVSPSLDTRIVGLHVVQNPRTRERYIVGGGDDGSVVFWSLLTFEPVARWLIFTSPLSKVLQLDVDKAGPLRGCALCVSRDGTIAIIVIDGFHFLYLVPGSTAPLTRLCLGGNNLLLIYADNRARLWDSQTKELWRSMGQDKAEELLGQGEWTDLTLTKHASIPKSLWLPIVDEYDGLDAAASLSLNLERLILDSIAITKTISRSKDEVREIFLALDRLKIILSILLTPGLNEDVDSICYGKLGALPSAAISGVSSAGATTLYDVDRYCEIWCISETVTATRSLAIISILRTMSLFEELTDGANTVISFYSVSLGACVGPRFKPPSIDFLGRRWFQASNELRSSIRTLFDATVSSLSDEEAIKITETWQHHVPTLQPDAEKESLNAALALLICGCIASEKYSLLSVNALMDISKSISLYLHDESSIYRALAIDLCSRGFHVWQHYIDSMEILRSLFNLATSSRKDSISIQNVGAQARLAVLSIASNNMPFLMNTLCLDILSPPTVEHRRSVLQVLAFLIKKRPYVLQAHLPRLMEAVVKSLDPNSTAHREIVLDAATEIISYVVKTYPTVCFHTASQRLAVGTNEGAVVMYDVKTAIRLYVLECHKKPITACSFSSDGRRLVSVCLKESTVLVWKVGSSFSSFFNPGAPPRQGHGGSDPFKTLNFNVGAEADMTTAEALDFVRVEWIADRSVKVKIRQSILTFST